MRGLLLTMTEPAPADEEEFNAWYDTEHLPERLAIPGFLSARRWVAADPVEPGAGKYLATYELREVEVLRSPEYLARIGEGFSPWSRRVLSRCVVFRRWACEQIEPGEAAPAEGAALFLACGDVPPEHEAEFDEWYDREHLPLLRAVDGVVAARRFRAREGAPRHVALYDLREASVPSSEAWKAAGQTPWARRIDALTEGQEWILSCYSSYSAPEAR